MHIPNIIILVLVSLFTFYLVGKLSFKFDLLDKPNKRKIHKVPTPYTGGVALILIFFFIIFYFEFDHISLNNILIYGSLIALGGFIDDKYNLNVGSKILFQLLPVIILMNEGLYISDINFGELGTIELGSFSKVFTCICCLYIINSLNYSDGIDGFATLISLSCFINLFLITNSFNYKFEYFLFYLSIVLLVFLVFNLNFIKFPKIFLGDCGSLLIGYIISFSVIFAHVMLNINAFALIWVFPFLVYEFLSTNLSRLIKKKNAFKPGKDHVHYYLLAKFKNKSYVILIGFVFNILIGLVGYYFFLVSNEVLSMLLFIAIFFIYFIYRKKISFERL